MDKFKVLEVLYVLEGRGIDPGSFTTSLIHTIVKADFRNRALLASIYPEYVEIVNAYTNREDGREVLLNIADGE